MKDFTSVKIPNAFTNITHSIEIGFILRSLYKPKALPINSQAKTLTAITIVIDWEKKDAWNSAKRVEITITARKITSAVAFVFTRKEDSLSMIWFFSLW
jgi:hypothetical protein